MKRSTSAVELSRSHAPGAGARSHSRLSGIRLAPLEADPLRDQLTLHRVTGRDRRRGDVEIASDNAWAHQTLHSLQRNKYGSEDSNEPISPTNMTAMKGFLPRLAKDQYGSEDASTPSTTYPSQDAFDSSYQSQDSFFEKQISYQSQDSFLERQDSFFERQLSYQSQASYQSQDSFFSCEQQVFERQCSIESVSGPDVKMATVEGAPSFGEALERLQTGFISEGESQRVRYAFTRFTCGEEELDRAVLDQVISHLGCIVVDEDVVKEMADAVTEMSDFELTELWAFLETYVTSEKDTVEAAFNKHAIKHAEELATISVHQVPLVMKDLQIVLLRPTLQELLQRAQLGDKACLDSEDVTRVLAAYRACEGFPVADVEKIQEVFEEAAENSTGSKAILNPSDLPNALLDFFGVHCVKQLRELVEDAGKAITDAGNRVSPVHFHEFLVWARQLRNAELLMLCDSFENVDADEDGIISYQELLTFMNQEGFTLSNSEAKEFFGVAGLDKKDSYCYDEAVAFLLACRKSEGFSRQDLEELSSAFTKFDTEGEGELTTLQVLDLLRYLGYEVRVEVVERYAHEVDFNENGTMDINEYLRLMRLHREEELENVHAVFHRQLQAIRAKSKRLPLCILKKSLIECKCCPPHCDVFDELCRESLDPSAVDFSYEEFIVLADKARKTVKQAQKMKANFSDAEVEVLQAIFRSSDVRGTGVLDQHQLSLLFYKCGVPLHTADSRQMIMDMLDKARQAALHAELSSEAVGEFGTFTATFLVMVHTWRMIARRIERKKLARLDEARAGSGFSLSEVEEFQKVFSTWLKRGSMKEEPSEPAPSSWGRRQSAPDMRASAPQDTVHRVSVTETGGVQERVLSLETILGLSKVNEQLTFEDLKKLLGHLKLKLSPSHSFSLQGKLRDITGDTQGSLDIADFLYLMKWMLDSNFASINEKAAHVAKSAACSASIPGPETSSDAEVDDQCRIESPQKASALRRRASV